jgi:excisionase family DNA binding protein
MPDNDSDLLAPSEGALFFAVTSPTVSRWADAGELTPVTTSGGHRRFRRDEVERVRLLAAHSAP